MILQLRRAFILWAMALSCSRFAQPSTMQVKKTLLVTKPAYTVELETGQIPRLWIESHGVSFFRLPVASGLASIGVEEKLTDLQEAPLEPTTNGATVLTVTAKSSIWTSRRFVWRFFEDHIEFQQFATGDRPVVRSYFFSNGISELYGYGTSYSIASNTIVDADRYYAPNANFDTALLHPLEESQSLGVAGDPGGPQLSREQSSRLFSPAPLVLSFGNGARWSSIGIGTTPGKYQFNGFEYSGEHFAGASFWVNYQGRTSGSDFASPVAAIHFGQSPIATLSTYMRWMDASGFSTHKKIPDVPWHHLPIFCGWGEQTSDRRRYA